METFCITPASMLCGQLDLAPEKSADVSKLMGVITADENSSAVLKKK